MNPRFIRGRQLFVSKFFQGDTGRATFWTLVLYGAHNFFVSKFSEAIRGRNFLNPHFIRGGQLFDHFFRCYTGRTTFLTLNFYGADDFSDPNFSKVIRGKQLFVFLCDYFLRDRQLFYRQLFVDGKVRYSWPK